MVIAEADVVRRRRFRSSDAAALTVPGRPVPLGARQKRSHGTGTFSRTFIFRWRQRT